METGRDRQIKTDSIRWKEQVANGQTDMEKVTKDADGDIETDRQTVRWCLKLSQPQRIIPGLGEIFIKRHILERRQ